MPFPRHQRRFLYSVQRAQHWISAIVGRYEAGVEGMGDLRRFNLGSQRMPSIRLTLSPPSVAVGIR
jgi:hypothetical protein